MFCSHCGSRLLEGSNQCLHCGRIEPSVRVAEPARPELGEERRRRRAPWVVGALLVVVNLALALGVASQAFVAPDAAPTPAGPQRPAEPPTEKILPAAERPLAEGWALSVAELQPEGFAAPVFVFPGELNPQWADLAVVVSASDEASYVRGLSLTQGSVLWVARLIGRVVCNHDRLDAVVCVSSDRSINTVRLVDGTVLTTHTGSVEAPQQVWVSPTGGLFVLSYVDPGGEGVRELGVTLTRVGDDGVTLATTTGTLPSRAGAPVSLHGAGPLLAVTTQADAPYGPTTPTLLRTQSDLGRVGALVDGLDVTVLPDGRLGVRTDLNSATLYDASGKELFPVAARLVTLPGRDVPSAETPTLGLVASTDETAPQPPTLLGVQPNGATAALGQGTPQLVCGGLLVTHDAVSPQRTFHAQEREGGSEVWQAPQHGELVDTACDGRRLLALTWENEMPVLRGYALTTGDTLWQVPFERRTVVAEVPGRGWLLHDPQENRIVIVRP